MLDFLTKKHIGVDFFNNHIRAVDYKEGIIYNESIKTLYEQLPQKLRTEKLKSQIDNFKYIYHEDTIYILFKDLIKSLNHKVVKPIVVLSVPSEIKHSDFGDLWINTIEDVLMHSNIDSLILVESIICAAYSLDIPFIKPKYNNLFGKFIIVHQTSKATVSGVLFKRNIHNTRIINKSPDNIKPNEIMESITSILNDNTFIPKELIEKKDSDPEKVILYQSWQKSFEKVINFVAPFELCTKLDSYFNTYFDDLKINCIENYETSIIKGLGKILIELNSDFDMQ